MDYYSKIFVNVKTYKVQLGSLNDEWLWHGEGCHSSLIFLSSFSRVKVKELCLCQQYLNARLICFLNFLISVQINLQSTVSEPGYWFSSERSQMLESIYKMPSSWILKSQSPFFSTPGVPW